MGFRLRYQRHDIELVPGAFLIGRSADCQLSLDDPLVSRRHALLLVTEDSVSVRDLDSRNGVFVNGTRIQGERQLSPGDTVTIGSQHLTIGRGDAAPLQVPPSNVSRSQTLTCAPIAAADSEPSSTASVEISKRTETMPLLGVLADKALGLGKPDEAERILSNALQQILKASEQREVIPQQTLELAARYATKLAGATGRGTWVDYVIRLYTLAERPLPAVLIEELHVVFRKVASFDLGLLRAYVAGLRARAASYGPAERFLVQRIEGLERLASVR